MVSIFEKYRVCRFENYSLIQKFNVGCYCNQKLFSLFIIISSNLFNIYAKFESIWLRYWWEMGITRFWLGSSLAQKSENRFYSLKRFKKIFFCAICIDIIHTLFLHQNFYFKWILWKFCKIDPSWILYHSTRILLVRVTMQIKKFLFVVEILDIIATKFRYN